MGRHARRVIYQAPTLHAVLSSRIRRCTWGLHQGLSKLQVRVASAAPAGLHVAFAAQNRGTMDECG